MKCFKILIIILLLSVVKTVAGQEERSVFDSIAEYITAEQMKSDNPYNMIMAADNVLSHNCTSFQNYKEVYQFLISGFSELGANKVVDYLVRMPYLEYIDTTEEQRAEILSIATQYERVKIGLQAPDIQINTIKKLEFTLSEIKSKNTIILFWSYSCPHCREMVKELGQLAKNDKDLAVVTVCVSGNLKQIKRLLKQAHLKNAYNIYDGKGWDSKIVSDYAVDMTPSLFLLDENKIIIAKPFDIEEVTNLIGL